MLSLVHPEFIESNQVENLNEFPRIFMILNNFDKNHEDSEDSDCDNLVSFDTVAN